jgi:NAD-dependent dihydropyrimidine dehydrogenase PreA subunit
MKNLQYLKNVVSLKLNIERCTGCGMCAIVCPHGVFEILKKKAHIIDVNVCMECGACAENCRFDAIYVKSGVGCAAAVINGILSNSEPSCDCSGDGKTACC